MKDVSDPSFLYVGTLQIYWYTPLTYLSRLNIDSIYPPNLTLVYGRVMFNLVIGSSGFNLVIGPFRSI